MYLNQKDISDFKEGDFIESKLNPHFRWIVLEILPANGYGNPPALVLQAIEEKIEEQWKPVKFITEPFEFNNFDILNVIPVSQVYKTKK